MHACMHVHECGRTSLEFLGGGATALEDLEVDDGEGHEAEGEAGHETCEEYEETGESSVREPPC